MKQAASEALAENKSDYEKMKAMLELVPQRENALFRRQHILQCLNFGCTKYFQP